MCVCVLLPPGCVTWMSAFQHTNPGVSPPYSPWSEWAEDCDEQRTRRKRRIKRKRVRVCWWGRKLAPSRHILLQTHGLVFLGLVCCFSLMLKQIPSQAPNTHTSPTSPLCPSRPPNPAQSASAWRRQSMLRAPLSVSAQGRAKGPSAGDCGKSDLWCPRCCWPLTFAPSLFIFPFVSPSLTHSSAFPAVTYLFNSVSHLSKWPKKKNLEPWQKGAFHSGTRQWTGVC